MSASITLDTARRIALSAQGFGRSMPAGVPRARQYAAVMARLGLIQLDSVNVCVRSHYMPFYARLGAYEREHLDSWLNTGGRHFEYWAHEASVMPVELYPLWRWKMQEWQPWKNAQAAMKQHPELVDQVLGQLHERGPLRVQDLDVPNKRSQAWWGYGPGKLVLEALFGDGRLTARRGPGFSRVYDLPARAIPAAIRADERYDKRLAHQELLLRAARHYGIATAKDLADYYRLKMNTAAPLVAELVACGELEAVRVEGWKSPAFLDPAARRPRAISAASLLSPFDPLTWCRERAERLFGFHYRIEIYTPREKRKYGYYVLPFLLDGELVARVDLKADRKRGILHVPSAFSEAAQEKSRVAGALAAELERFADWLGLASIQLGSAGNLMRELRRTRRSRPLRNEPRRAI